jgi:hypothetical protein
MGCSGDWKAGRRREVCGHGLPYMDRLKAIWRRRVNERDLWVEL